MINEITLSFDNGPTEAVTSHVLSILAKYEIKSTFFVLGKNLQSDSNRALIRRAAAEGHWIGNHTFNHGAPLGRHPDPNAAANEVGATQKLISDVAHPERFFRPNGGGGVIGDHLLSQSVLEYLQAGEYSCVLWNAIPHDWDDPSNWVSRALGQCRVLQEALVVLHDKDTGAMVHLESFIQSAIAEGATFKQAFPDSCVPLKKGVAVQSMTPFVTPRIHDDQALAGRSAGLSSP